MDYFQIAAICFVGGLSFCFGFFVFIMLGEFIDNLMRKLKK